MGKPTAIASSRIVAFVATTSAERARSFYGGTLGLRVVSEDAFAVVFDANGTTLRAAIVKEAAAVGYTVLGWQVADIGAAVTQLAAAGVRFERYPGISQDAAGIWTSPSGARVAWFKDPDGNTLSLTQ